MRPDTFTVTTFWLDWLLMPIMLVGAWFTGRWALADAKQASEEQAKGESTLPPWSFSIPLFMAAVAWVIAGFGALIKEDYWEMWVIFVAYALWTLSCIAGAVLLLVSTLRKDRARDTVNLIGLWVMSILLVLPGLINHTSPDTVTAVGHLWFVLLAISVALLTAGTLRGFPYRFPRFPLGLGLLFLFGWGLSEINFQQASFPWLVRMWRRSLGIEYLDRFPIAAAWQVHGAIKVLLAIAAVVVLIVGSRQRREPEA